MRLKRERRLALMPYLWQKVTLYGTVVMVTHRGRPRILLKGVGLEDGTWVADHLWVPIEIRNFSLEKKQVSVTGVVHKYLPYGEVQESYSLENPRVEEIRGVQGSRSGNPQAGYNADRV